MQGQAGTKKRNIKAADKEIKKVEAVTTVSAANAKLNEFKYDKDELAKKMQATAAMTSKFIREFFKGPKNKEEPVEL